MDRRKNDDIVVFSKKIQDPDAKGSGIYVFSKKGVKRRRIEDVCEHKDERRGGILCIGVGPDESQYLLIVCEHCKKMHIMDLTDGKYYLALHKSDISFGPVCRGKPNFVYLVASKPPSDTVLVYVLGTKSVRFSIIKSFRTQLVGTVTMAACDPSLRHLLLFESKTNNITAVDTNTAATVWSISMDEAGPQFIPRSLAVFCKRDAEETTIRFLLVSDHSDKVRVYSTRDGKHLQDIALSRCSGIVSMLCSDDLLVTQQKEGNTLIISGYKLEYNDNSTAL